MQYPLMTSWNGLYNSVTRGGCFNNIDCGVQYNANEVLYHRVAHSNEGFRNPSCLPLSFHTGIREHENGGGHYMASSPRSSPSPYGTELDIDMAANGHDLDFLSTMSGPGEEGLDEKDRRCNPIGPHDTPSHAATATADGEERGSRWHDGTNENLSQADIDSRRLKLLEESLAGQRRRGRPVGSKDSQPRSKKGQEEDEDDDRIRRKRPWKILLTAEQAVEIYAQRPLGETNATSSCRSNEVAARYGVNSKTIRDIWNRSTWVKATRSVWLAWEEADYVRQQLLMHSNREKAAAEEGTGGEGPSTPRRRGRPQGVRDTKPRIKRRASTQGDLDGGGATNSEAILSQQYHLADSLHTSDSPKHGMVGGTVPASRRVDGEAQDGSRWESMEGRPSKLTAMPRSSSDPALSALSRAIGVARFGADLVLPASKGGQTHIKGEEDFYSDSAAHTESFISSGVGEQQQCLERSASSFGSGILRESGRVGPGSLQPRYPHDFGCRDAGGLSGAAGSGSAAYYRGAPPAAAQAQYGGFAN